VFQIGPGFHFDTAAADYVDQAGEPTLNRRQARLLNYDLGRAAALLGDEEYEAVCLIAGWQALGVRFERHSAQLIHITGGSS